ncbi:MAG TPA: hypothetical protein PLV13_00835 [Ilumatobacteraceae bacterium]|nr:hypothetical protein [Ilumatobacteraceae bacterium]
MTLIVIGIVVVVAALVALVLSRRRPSHEPGVASFQRHLSALSSDARRQSIGRGHAQPGRPQRPGG